MNAGLLLVDVQQDYLARPGLCPSAAALIDRLAALLEACRSEAATILHVRTLIDVDGHDRMPHWKRLDRWACVKGTPGAEPPRQLAALPEEPVVAKPFFSAFGNPEVDRLLRQSSVDTVIVAGMYTHACVRTTVLDAYQAGYVVWLPADGVASDQPLHADLSLSYLDGRACEVVSSSDVAGRLRARASVAPAARDH
jgi:aldehyde dehydrogenase (NAD+)